MNYTYLLSRFKISRTTLQRIINYGVLWAESGQKVGRKWADNELIITFGIELGGQKVGRKWAESGRLNDSEPKQKSSQEKQNAIGSKESLKDSQSDNADTVSTKIRTKPNSDKLYPVMLEIYDDFCKERIGMGAKMNAHQGKAMKNIITYLATQVKNKKGDMSQDELKREIIKAWQYILSNWSSINGYYAEQIKLSQIDSNIPNLLVQLKNTKIKARNEKFANRESQIGGVNFEQS